ncbi:MAG: acyl transferase [Saprospiraceae bacterium]|nr:acyl transferase [Saprospiraceae bacterium]MCF8250793.1 acyl transferase [Saprospiraceae bacterium]MCF8283015.1 acyltransferase [Bacteroidales bacterium]MCF8312594.1 acyl transferase [Saprospiraceae bacterium]MCF8440923.1 acyl transferase [Saprospiraceae bacterium]
MPYEQQRASLSQQLEAFDGAGFEALALEIFRFQAAHNPLYGRYLALLNVDVQATLSIEQIPFLPIQFFKNYEVKTGDWLPETTFTSSGTTGETTSRHHVRGLDFHKRNTVQGFQQFYGDPSDWLVLALLPSYLERSGSSLVFMAEHFIQLSKHPQSGFFLNNVEELINILRSPNFPISQFPNFLLLGVSFALLDLAERHSIDLQHVTIMETGGMKGRRRELTRSELHDTLKTAFNAPTIHSEYGMTELFSQAYSTGDGLFRPASTLRAFTREITDPLTPQLPGKTGILNLIDLANFDTCSFIATDDLGRVFPDGSFEVLGRVDNSDVRGCNLLVDKG